MSSRAWWFWGRWYWCWGGSALTDPGTALQGLAMVSDRDRSWWQRPSTAPDMARDEPGPGPSRSPVRGERRQGRGQNHRWVQNAAGGWGHRQDLEPIVTHICAGCSQHNARGAKVQPGHKPGGKHAYRTAQEGLKAWNSMARPQGQGSGNRAITTY